MSKIFITILNPRKMNDTTNKKISPELREELNKLVLSLGGLNSASKFLDVNIASLRSYLDGSKSEIRSDIWKYNISPSLNKNQEDLLSQFSSELRKLRKAQNKISQYEYEIAYIDELHKKQIESLLESPFIIYFKEFLTDYKGKYHYPIIEDLEKLKAKENDSVPFDKLIRDIDEFKRLYDLFRPVTITHDHPYHGTVKMMDGIFDTFASVFNIKYGDRFSKYGYSWIDQLYEKKHDFNEIKWDWIISDLKTICESIDDTIAELALDNVEYFKEFHKYYFSEIVCCRVNKLFRTGTTNQILVENIQPGEIKIENKTIRFRNRIDLEHQIFEMHYQNFK